MIRAQHRSVPLSRPGCIRFCLLLLLLLPFSPPAWAQEGQPVLIPQARQFDVASKINGQTYRLFVRLPTEQAPPNGYPVFYVLDGNYYFGIVADEASRLIRQRTVEPFIVVGIGYPTTDMDEVGKRRDRDLTLPAWGKVTADYGGADAFLRVLNEELRPFVAAHFKVDPGNQVLFGHSFGALTALHELFLNPGAFTAYVLSSPSIFWVDKEVLKDEAAFSEKARRGGVHAKILITSAGNEQNNETSQLTLMIDNASELASRLASLNPQQMPVTRVIFEGESHRTVPQASTARGVVFSIPPPPRE
jgi:uncharacterized protein